MSDSVKIIVGIALLAGVVLFIASLATGGGVSLSLSGDESTFAMRYSERGGDGFFTGIAMDINAFFSDFGWYRDLSHAWFELGEPVKVLLNWVLGGFWAMIFLRRR
jgi:hypothetical protein